MNVAKGELTLGNLGQQFYGLDDLKYANDYDIIDKRRYLISDRIGNWFFAPIVEQLILTVDVALYETENRGYVSRVEILKLEKVARRSPD